MTLAPLPEYSIYDLAARAGLGARRPTTFQLARLRTALVRHGWRTERKLTADGRRRVWFPPSPSYDVVPEVFA